MHQFLQSLNDVLIAGFYFEIPVRWRQPSSRSTISKACQIMLISRFRGLLLRFGIRKYLGTYQTYEPFNEPRSAFLTADSWPVQR